MKKSHFYLSSLVFIFFITFSSCNLHTEYLQYKNARTSYNDIDYQCVAAYVDVSDFENIVQKDDRNVTFSFYDKGFLDLKLYFISDEKTKTFKEVNKFLLKYQSSQPVTIEVRGEREASGTLELKDKWETDTNLCEKEIDFANKRFKSINIRIDGEKGTELTVDCASVLFKD